MSSVARLLGHLPVTIACRPKPKEINCRIVKEQSDASHLTSCSRRARKHSSAASARSTARFEAGHFFRSAVERQSGGGDPSDTQLPPSLFATGRLPAVRTLFFSVQNHRNVEAVPLPLDRDQHLIARVSRLDRRQEIVRSPHGLPSHGDDQIRSGPVDPLELRDERPLPPPFADDLEAAEPGPLGRALRGRTAATSSPASVW